MRWLRMLAGIVRRIMPENMYLKTSLFLHFRLFRKEIQLTQEYARQISMKPRKDRITAVFVIWAESMWNSLCSVYEHMNQDERFATYIIAQPHITDRMGKENQNPCFAFLSALYGNVINAYTDGVWFDLTSLNPDYVFYTYPYISCYCEAYNPENVRKYAKVCLIQYGFNLLGNAMFTHGYNFLFSKNVAIQFVSCVSARKKLGKYYGKIEGEYPRIECLGFPRFDLVERRDLPPLKIEPYSHKPCVLWTPRWSAPSERTYDTGSSFLAYRKDFLAFAESHKGVSFIIRPHPLMFQNFIARGIMSQSEVGAFRLQCAALGNVTIDESADYLVSIGKASIFLADLSSLLAEFFVTGKPVIFCAEGKDFIPEAKIMDSALYHAKSWDAAESLLTKLLSGEDKMCEIRLAAIREFLPQKSGTSAESILSFIKDDYYGTEQ